MSQNLPSAAVVIGTSMVYIVHFQAVSQNYKQSMTSLDPYLEYLVANDPRYYYFLSEMEQVNHCMGKIEFR